MAELMHAIYERKTVAGSSSPASSTYEEIVVRGE
jgi:hypothetical protein